MARTVVIRHLQFVAVLTSALIALGVVLVAPTADAATEDLCYGLPIVKAVDTRSGDTTARVCMRRDFPLVIVYDTKKDGLHATGYWSSENGRLHGSFDNFDGAGQWRSFHLPLRHYEEVCFRAAAKNHDEVVNLSNRACVRYDGS